MVASNASSIFRISVSDGKTIEDGFLFFERGKKKTAMMLLLRALAVNDAAIRSIL